MIEVMKERTETRLDYNILKKDLIMVNAIVGSVVVVMFVSLLLQRLDLIPHFPCLMHEVLHVYCPGCGGTRAIFALLQGDIVKSLYCNPAVILGALLVLHYEIGAIVTLIKKNGKQYYCSNMSLVIGYGLVIGLFSVVRNYLLLSFGFDMLEGIV